MLQVSAQGIFEAYLGGRKVGDDVLSPGWSSYEWRLRYREYDVTDQLQDQADGAVVLGIALGNGWFRGRLTWSGARHLYGDRLGAIAALTISYADGYQQVIRTDESWTSGPSHVLADDFYDGQTIDARLASDAWLQPGFTDETWTGVVALDFDPDKLIGYVGPPVVRHEEVRPVEIWQSPEGKTLIDFGQNLVGWLKFTVTGERGQTITLRHAEVLEHGELGVRPLRTAKATDELILSGGEDFFEPTFTFHGFRYAEVVGWPGELTADSLVAVVVSSAARAHRHLRVLRPAAQQAAPQCGLGSTGQLRRRADRLPAARRAAGLDRRPRGLRPDRIVPVRLQPLPAGLAARPGCRAAGGGWDGRRTWCPT